MHELTLAENILDIVSDSLRDQPDARVTRISIDIGRLSGVEPDALKFAMDAVVKETFAETAKLEYQFTEGQIRCLDCNRVSPAHNLYSQCSHCQSFRVDIVGGQELKVSAIEIETTD